jgi:hypothetical protein
VVGVVVGVVLGAVVGAVVGVSFVLPPRSVRRRCRPCLGVDLPARSALALFANEQCMQRRRPERRGRRMLRCMLRWMLRWMLRCMHRCMLRCMHRACAGPMGAQHGARMRRDAGRDERNAPATRRLGQATGRSRWEGVGRAVVSTCMQGRSSVAINVPGRATGRSRRETRVPSTRPRRRLPIRRPRTRCRERARLP